MDEDEGKRHRCSDRSWAEEHWLGSWRQGITLMTLYVHFYLYLCLPHWWQMCALSLRPSRMPIDCLSWTLSLHIDTPCNGHCHLRNIVIHLISHFGWLWQALLNFYILLVQCNAISEKQNWCAVFFIWLFFLLFNYSWRIWWAWLSL